MLVALWLIYADVLQYRLHDVARTTTHLLIDAPNIFAQKSDTEKDYAHHKEGNRKQREQTLSFSTENKTTYQEQSH